MAAVRNLQIGFVFQSFFMLPRLSALANVELPLPYTDAARADREARVREVLAQVGLADRAEHPPANYQAGRCSGWQSPRP